MRQKYLSKAEKKAFLEVKKVDNNKEAGNNKNMGNDKDASLSIFAIVAFPCFFAFVAAFFGFRVLVAASLGLLTPGSVNFSIANTTGTFITVYPSPFSFFVWLSPFSFPAYHITPIFLSPMQVHRSISLFLEDNYAVMSRQPTRNTQIMITTRYR